jgi:hypothetical protein
MACMQSVVFNFLLKFMQQFCKHSWVKNKKINLENQQSARYVAELNSRRLIGQGLRFSDSKMYQFCAS